MKNKNSFGRTLLCLSLLALAAGCAHKMPVSVLPTAMPVGDKLHQHVALALNKDLADYKYTFHMMGDAFVYSFGPPLKNYARHVAGASFQQVDEATSPEQAFANTSADIVLIPRAVKADQSSGVWAASTANFTLVVEWTAKDRASQNTIWLKTITADSSEKMGSLFSHKGHERKLMQKLFDDLSLKTYQAFQEAPELRSSQH